MNNRLHLLFLLFRNSGKSTLFGLFIAFSLSTAGWATDAVPEKAPAALSISVNPASAVCAGTSVNLTASGCATNGAIRWSTPQTGASITVAPTQTTTYTAYCDVTTTSVVTTTATSSSATSTTSLVNAVTTTTATATVQVYAPIALTTSIVPVSCNNEKDGQVNISASGGTGGLQYQFNNQGYQTLNTLFGNLKAGAYPVAVKDGQGCIAQVNVTVTQPAALSATVTVVAPKCLGGTDGGFIAVASGGIGNYRYILNNGTPQESGTFVNLAGNTTYLLSVTDKNSCIATQPVIVGTATPFVIKPIPTPTRCAGSADGSVTISVTGGNGIYQYQFSNGNFQAGSQFTGLAANTYQINVKDGNGCVGTQSVVIEQPKALSLTAIAKPVNCFGANSGSITLTPGGGTGAVTYQLTTVRIPQLTTVFSGLTVGDYTVVGIDANGCTSLVAVTIGKADPLKLTATVTPATCCVCPTGVVKLASTGGTGTNKYQLIGQAYQASNQINGLRPNAYSFRVSDDAGCTDSVAAVVTDGASLSLSTGTVKNISCTGGKDGEATVQVAGGQKPYTYYWLTERQDTLKTFAATQTGLVEGTYTVSVRDSNRCTTPTIFVSLKAQNPVPFKPVVSQTGSGTLTVDQSTGIQWYIRSGTNPATAVPNATAPTLVPFTSGQYYVVVTQNGCASPPSDGINFILTALSEPDARLSVRVVPNPITDRLRLEIEQVERSAVQIQLLDASGRAVREYQLPAFTGKKQAEWPLTGMSTGTYLLKASAESRQSVIRVLIE